MRTTRGKVRRWTAIAALAVAGAGCAAVAADGGRAGVVGGSLLVAIVGLPGLRRLARDRLDAVGLYTLVTVVTFGALSLLWLGSPAIPAPGVGRADVARALLIVALGLAVFLLAARAAGPAQDRPPLRLGASAEPPLTLLVVLFGIGVVATALGLALGVTGYTATTDGSRAVQPWAQFLAQGSIIGPIVVLVCALQAFGAGDKRAWRLLPWLVAAQVLIGFASGFKGASLLPIAYTALAYVSVTSRIPWRPLGVVAVVTFGLLLPANFVYRAVLRGDGGGAPRAVFNSAAQNMSARFRLVDHVALIDTRTPSVYPYGGGSRYLELPAIIAVPRALWHDKPVLADGVRFSQTYWEIPPVSRTSTPLTQIGDLLRNFGLPGVAIGMAVWGLVVALFGALCHRLRSARVEMIYIVSLVGWVTYVEGDLPTLVALASRSMAVTIAVAWLLLPGRSQPAGYRVLLDAGSRAVTRIRGAGSRGDPQL